MLCASAGSIHAICSSETAWTVEADIVQAFAFIHKVNGLQATVAQYNFPYAGNWRALTRHNFDHLLLEFPTRIVRSNQRMQEGTLCDRSHTKSSHGVRMLESAFGLEEPGWQWR